MNKNEIRKALLDEIKNKAPMKGSMREKILQSMEMQYQKTKDNELLSRIARLLMLDNSPEQVSQTLTQKLNLGPQEQRALYILIQEKIEKK